MKTTDCTVIVDDYAIPPTVASFYDELREEKKTKSTSFSAP